jgi:hypothetical protein
MLAINDPLACLIFLFNFLKFLLVTLNPEGALRSDAPQTLCASSERR